MYSEETIPSPHCREDGCSLVSVYEGGQVEFERFGGPEEGGSRVLYAP